MSLLLIYPVMVGRLGFAIWGQLFGIIGSSGARQKAHICHFNMPRYILCPWHTILIINKSCLLQKNNNNTVVPACPPQSCHNVCSSQSEGFPSFPAWVNALLCCSGCSLSSAKLGTPLFFSGGVTIRLERMSLPKCLRFAPSRPCHAAIMLSVIIAPMAHMPCLAVHCLPVQPSTSH